MFSMYVNYLRKEPPKLKKILELLSNNKTLKVNYATESATFETMAFRLHKLEAGPSTTVTVTKEEALLYFRQMQTMRKIESAAGSLYRKKFIRGFCHLYTGEEAVAVGIKAVMRPHDAVISSYRTHGWTYLMGVSEVAILSELTGRQSGVVRGKAGSMHLFTDNFYGGQGIVGAQVPLGTGVAFALKYKNTDGVCVTLYGDGASNQGQVFEAFNMAKLWNIPCVYVCENNKYGMGTSMERSSASTEYYKRGDYIPGIWMDGMDVLAVKAATKFAIDYASSGKGPIILEASTYRYTGHSMSDPGTSYRSREEIQEVRKKRDTIAHFKEEILSAKLATADQLKKIEDEIKERVEKSMEFAKVDKEVGFDDLAGDIYANNLEQEIRNVLPFNPLKHKRIGKSKNLQ